MSRQLLQIVLAFALACGLAGCSRSSAPSAPTPPPAASPGVPQSNQMQMAGTVSDSAFRPLGGATVEVVDGPQAGRSTITSARGEFSLSGAFDDTTRFRATKEGHVPLTSTLQPHCAPCNPNRWIHFYLPLLVPSADIAGNYTLTVTADGACAAFPSAVRTYAATLVPVRTSHHPANTFYEGTVSGAEFLQGYNSFSIGVAGDYFTGWFGDLHGDPGLVEQVAATTYFALGGEVAGSVTGGSTITGALDGFIDSCELQAAMGSRYNCTPGPVAIRAQCYSRNHRLTLARR
jgi:carboxypeptidase family protein